MVCGCGGVLDRKKGLPNFVLRPTDNGLMDNVNHSEITPIMGKEYVFLWKSCTEFDELLKHSKFPAIS